MLAIFPVHGALANTNAAQQYSGDAMNKPVRMMDTLANLITGLGTLGSDKNFSTRYTLTAMSVEQIEAAYRGDWVARKAVNIPAEDSTREWRDWQAENKQIEVIEAEEKRLGLQRKVKRALIRARLYGGGAIIMGVDGNSSDELDVESVGQGGLKYLHVVSRYELQAGEMEWDVRSEFYGQPKHYRPTARAGNSAEQADIHPSRVIRFIGNELPDLSRSDSGWGDSVMQSIDDSVKNVGLTSQGIAALVHEAKLDVIKVPDLSGTLSTELAKARLIDRFQLMAMMKSLINVTMLDKEEDWQRVPVDFAGLPDILKLYILIVSGAVDVPATRFLGQSAAGLNSTGDADIRNYYDRLKSDQETEIRPTLTPLDEVLLRSALGSRPPEIYYEWSPLWQMTEGEKADIAVKKANAHKVDVESGLIPADVLREVRENQLIEDGFYPGMEHAIEEFEDQPIDERNPEVQRQFGEASAAKRAAQPQLQQLGPNGLPMPNNVVQLRPANGQPQPTGDAEFTFISNDGVFSGYAVRWGEKSKNDGLVFRKGAFTKSIDAKGEAGIKMLYQHADYDVIGVWKYMAEDRVGLFVRGQINLDLELGREVVSNMQKGALDGLSVGYWDAKVEGGEVVEADLAEISIVTFPALSGSQVDSVPKTLYVRRDVTNVKDIVAWARKQGFENIVPDLHVTIIYSKASVDWIKMGEPFEERLEIKAGGPRVVEPLGDQGAIVLMFASSALCWRHEDMTRRGASHDYEEFQPHITISYDPGPKVLGGLAKLEPYRGPIVLGPEIFEDIT